MGHGRRANLTRLEPLSGQLVAGHQPDRSGQVGRPPGCLGQRRDHIEVQRPRVYLPHRVQDLSEAKVVGHQLFQLVDPGAVAAHEVHLVLLGPHRSLQPPERVSSQQIGDPTVRSQELLGRCGEPLAQRGGLGGHVVATPDHDQAVELGSQAC